MNKNIHSLSNTRGGFLHFIFMIVVIIILMNYFHISLGEVIGFATQLLNAILELVYSLINAVVKLGQGVQVPQAPQI